MVSLEQRIDYIANEMANFPEVVHIGFSGGKDSSAVVKLLASALLQRKGNGPRIEIVYCDTGVENPIVDRFVKSTLRRLDDEFASAKLNCSTRIIEPLVAQSFFVRMIGRGYPPPTNSFRWCTKDIRIRPFQHFLKNQTHDVLIAIGTRKGESNQRDRSLKKSEISSQHSAFYQRQRDGFARAVLFAPIIDFSVGDVWEALVDLPFPQSISVETLAKLYKDGGGECPTVRDFKDKPCSRARFGCWTCTVVRRDRSTENMMDQGHDELRPYFEFRHWLTQIRGIDQLRCKMRRNGRDGPGPFTLSARQMLFDRVRDLEEETGKSLISKAHEEEIRRLWDIDSHDVRYAEIE